MTLQLTNAGINALLRAMSGDEITLTRVKVGNGEPQPVGTATDLANPLAALSISALEIANQKATISVTLTNSTLEAGFRMTEIGVFAQDQDDSSAEILYAYGTEPDSTADYIAASGDSILEEDITIDVFVSNAENVSAIINESLVYATKTDFDAHLADTNNPHGVTKAQVDLGNVPNVATNDQTPTYTEASENANLISGERLTIAFGKIAKAIRSLIAHISATGNVHGATASQIGAAASVHYHSTAQITSGTLSVTRGGTGETSYKNAATKIVPYFFANPSVIGVTDDLNDFINPGFYLAAQGCGHTPADAPTGAGFVLVFALSSNAVTQIYLSQSAPSSGQGKIFVRSKIGGYNFDPWQ